MSDDRLIDPDKLLGLISLINSWGWVTAVENIGDEAEIDGLILGTDEFIESLIGGDDKNAWTIYDERESHLATKTLQ